VIRVLIACEYSGTVCDVFRAEGYDATSCDILPTEAPGPHYQGDALALLDQGWDLLIGHPPCTYLSVSGNRWLAEDPSRRAKMERAAEFFLTFTRAPVPFIAIENPVCVMSSLYRKPDQTVQPWQFGHGEVKRTCFWLRNLPLLRPTAIVEGREERIHRMPPGPDRAKMRSKTYEGIATAMAQQWGAFVTSALYRDPHLEREAG
jgi:hypothetical protein